MAVDFGTGELKFGYMERKGQSVPSEKVFPAVSCIDMSKFTQKSDLFFNNIKAAIKKMDYRERADNQYSYADLEIDPKTHKGSIRKHPKSDHTSDYALLQKICNPLMKSLLEMLKEVNRVKKDVGDKAPMTGKEPIYIFGKGLPVPPRAPPGPPTHTSCICCIWA